MILRMKPASEAEQRFQSREAKITRDSKTKGKPTRIQKDRNPMKGPSKQTGTKTKNEGWGDEANMSLTRVGIHRAIPPKRIDRSQKRT